MAADPPPDEEGAALRRAAASEAAQALAEVWERHQAGLRRMLELRMDPRLRARLSASDVLQDAWLEVRERLDAWRALPAAEAMPLRLWLRFLTTQRLLQARRFHLERHKRSGLREQPLAGLPLAGTTAGGVADALAASLTSPHSRVGRAELHAHLSRALAGLPDIDREILVRRHVEGLSNVETARELGIEPSAASKRFLRALERLRADLEAQGIGLEEAR